MKPSIYNILHKSRNGKIFLFNSKTKASITLPPLFDTSFLTEINSFNALSKEEKKLLVDNGFFVDDSLDELAEVNYMFNMHYFDTNNINIALVPTLKCNFNCPYCFEKGYGEIPERKDYFDVLKKYSEKTFKHKNFVCISLFGGEPLVCAEKVFDYLEFVSNDSLKHDYKFITTITTNGSLLNEDVIKKLIKYHLYSLQITLDGNRESHNKTRVYHDGSPSFDILISKIKLLLDMTENYDFVFYLRINLLNQSTETLTEILSEFEEKYRKRINVLVRPIYQTKKFKEKNTNNREELEPFFAIAEEMGFKINKNTYYFQACESCSDSRFFYLMPDLSMWKCVHNLGYTKAKIGCITSDGSVQTIPENIIDWYKAANCFADEECLKCSKLPSCWGGCILYKQKNNTRSCKSFDWACLPFCMND